MDKISKALRKISSSDALKIADTIELLIKDQTKGLDIKKLKGYQDIFRVRVGKYRIIYRKEKETIFILTIERRGDNTYR